MSLIDLERLIPVGQALACALNKDKAMGYTDWVCHTDPDVVHMVLTAPRAALAPSVDADKDTDDTHDGGPLRRRTLGIYHAPIGVNVRMGRHPADRVVVTGNWPIGMHPNTFHDPSAKAVTAGVSASLTRGPEAIAKDIMRRFVPGYVALWNAQNTRAQVVKAEEQGQAATLKRLLDAGCTASAYDWEKHRVRVARMTDGLETLFQGEIIVSYNGAEGTLTLTTSADRLVRLLGVLFTEVP